jgi:hypothetical protein
MHFIREITARIDLMLNAVDRAKEIGTYNALDRSAQYPLDDAPKFKKAINEAWAKIHYCERELRAKEAAIKELTKQLGRYKIANIALTSILTGLAWEGTKAFLKWLLP